MSGGRGAARHGRGRDWLLFEQNVAGCIGNDPKHDELRRRRRYHNYFDDQLAERPQIGWIQLIVSPYSKRLLRRGAEQCSVSPRASEKIGYQSDDLFSQREVVRLEDGEPGSFLDRFFKKEQEAANVDVAPLRDVLWRNRSGSPHTNATSGELADDINAYFVEWSLVVVAQPPLQRKNAAQVVVGRCLVYSASVIGTRVKAGNMSGRRNRYAAGGHRIADLDARVIQSPKTAIRTNQVSLRHDSVRRTCIQDGVQDRKAVLHLFAMRNHVGLNVRVGAIGHAEHIDLVYRFERIDACLEQRGKSRLP